MVPHSSLTKSEGLRDSTMDITTPSPKHSQVVPRNCMVYLKYTMVVALPQNMYYIFQSISYSASNHFRRNYDVFYKLNNGAYTSSTAHITRLWFLRFIKLLEETLSVGKCVFMNYMYEIIYCA